VGSAAPAAAQEAFDETWNVEFSNGPIIAPANVVGRGGAEIGIAEGSGSQSLNPAAVANRFSYNGGEWFDWDWSVGWFLVGIGDTTDLANDERIGKSDTNNIFEVGLNFMFNRFGVGIHIPIQQQARSCQNIDDTNVCELDVVQPTFGLNLGYNFFDGALVVATELLLPVAVFQQNQIVDGRVVPLYESTMSGLGAHIGVLWRPHRQPFRVGATFRTPMCSNQTEPAATTPSFNRDRTASRGRGGRVHRPQLDPVGSNRDPPSATRSASAASE